LRYNGFQDRRIRPLCHSSRVIYGCKNILIKIFAKNSLKFNY